MDEWLSRARDLLATEAGIEPDALVLDDVTTATLLELARIAAHTSGDRRNAPLLCFLVGRASAAADVEALAARLRAL